MGHQMMSFVPTLSAKFTILEILFLFKYKDECPQPPQALEFFRLFYHSPIKSQQVPSRLFNAQVIPLGTLKLEQLVQYKRTTIMKAVLVRPVIHLASIVGGLRQINALLVGLAILLMDLRVFSAVQTVASAPQLGHVIGVNKTLS